METTTPTPLTTKDAVPFTPSRYVRDGVKQDGAVTYQIGTLSLRERAAYNRDLTAAGARLVTTRELGDALREAIAAVLEGDERDEALGQLEEYDQRREQQLEVAAKVVEIMREAREQGAAEGEELPDSVKAQLERIGGSGFDDDAGRAVLAYVSNLEIAMARAYPPYAVINADRLFYFEVSRMLAAQYALRGWEGLAVSFVRKNGKVPEDVLEHIPELDRFEIGIQAQLRMQPGAAEKKS
jgi:hypothetical protein